MLSKSRFTLTTATVLMVFALSAMWAGPAFADDTVPPPVDPTTIEVPPPVDEPVVVPEGTDLVVVNESGDAVPLASQEAADAIATGDPLWCPTGVAPKASTGGCSISYGSLSALVAGGSHAANGTIWIENGAAGGSEATFNGTGTWASAANFSLTLQGGWIGGITGSKAIIGTSIFDTAISIINWNGAVTVSDITMQGAANTTFAGAGALYVSTKKNILLSNVTSINTASGATDGAFLDNTSSTTQATVTVKNSSFNNNTSWGGLVIYSDGVVTLTNVNANNNNKYGVYISNAADSAAWPVTVTNSSLNGNTNFGLKIYSNGSVKLSQVTANANGDTGVYVDNYSTVPDLHPMPVTVIGFLTAMANSGSGLEINSKGVVTLTNLTTSFNSGFGTDIDNTYGTAQTAVNITGTNIFNNNFYNGLAIASLGAITLSNLTASRNGNLTEYSGVYVYNNFNSTKPQNITLNGYNFFLHNGYDGLTVYSYGAITISNVTAVDNGNDTNDNGGSGVGLYNNGGTIAKNITVNGTNFFTDNDGSGLEAYSLGMITVSNITASSNNYGAYLDNAATGAKSAVLVNGYGVFELNANDGLYVTSHGAITTKNLSANFNLGNGANLNTIGVLATQAVTLNGNNNFNFNGNAGTESGLVVYSDGTIKVNNINASYNYYRGANLDNFTNWDAPVVNFATFGSVTVTGFGNFTDNGNDGLNIYTHGAATLNYITANFNGDDGIGMDADKNVTVVCSSANNNAWGFWMYGSPSPVLTLKGLITAGNTFGNDENLLFTILVRTRCP